MKKSHERIERSLVDAFLKGSPPPGSTLQSERDLAAQFSVSRATVREALYQLEKSGWISKQQRHATVVNDFWSTGDLELLSSIERNCESFPVELAIHILELRIQLAPDYAHKAVARNRDRVVELLSRAKRLSEGASAIAKFDWDLHLNLAILSGNRIYPLMMNSSAHIYSRLRRQFFGLPEIRRVTRGYYLELLRAAVEGDGEKAEEVTRRAMTERLALFKEQADRLTGEEEAAPPPMPRLDVISSSAEEPAV